MSALPKAGSQDALYIVDLACWMHRFFRTMGGRSAHGFIEFIGKVLRNQRPAFMAICADLPFPTFRAELYPKKANGEGYKAHREPPDPTLLERMRWAKWMAEDVHGIPIFSKRGFEADDLIAALVEQAKHHGMRVVILGLDKDLLQLVDDRHTVMWDGKNTVWGVPEVIEKFGVRPDQLRDYLAICGDTADNIPGVKGMGPKAAAELLQAFGSLEAAVEHARDMHSEGKLHELFRQRPRYRDMLIRSYGDGSIELSIKLATLAIDAPLKHTIADCRRDT